MKKFILAVLCITTCVRATSQINKKDWMFGGNVNWTTAFNNSHPGKTNSTLLTATPDAGYFFIDKLAAGLKFSFILNNPIEGYASTTFGIAPFLRYYILPKKNNINLFAEASYGWNRTNMAGDQDNSFHQWSLSAGPSIFLNSHIALEFALNYTHFSGQYYYGGNTASMGMNIGFQVHLGK